MPGQLHEGKMWSRLPEKERAKEQKTGGYYIY